MREARQRERLLEGLAVRVEPRDSGGAAFARRAPAGDRLAERRPRLSPMRPSGSCSTADAWCNVLADEQNPELLAELARLPNAAGLITICIAPPFGGEDFLVVDERTLPPGPAAAAEEICRLLEAGGFIPEATGPLTGGDGI